MTVPRTMTSLRGGIPLRATMLMDAPHGAVRRALGRADVWTRTVRAMGGRAEIAAERTAPQRSGARAPLRAGDMIRVHIQPSVPGDSVSRDNDAGPTTARELLWPARPLIFRVLDGAGIPAPESVVGSAAQVQHADRLPVVELVAGPLKSCRISLTTAATPAGTMVTIDFRVQAAPVALTPLLRGRILRIAELFLGIAMLASRENQVVVAGAVIANGTVLAARRTFPPAAAGRWELPGGKVDPGETDQGALVRELAEELGVLVVVGDRIGGDVDLGENTVLRCYRAMLVSGEPRPIEHDQLRWIGATELDTVQWLDGDRLILDDLRRVLPG